MSKCERCEYSTYDELWNEYICKKRGVTLYHVLDIYKDCEYFTERKENGHET